MSLVKVLQWCQKLRHGTNDDIHEWWFHADRDKMDPTYRSHIDTLCQQHMANQLLEEGYVTIPFLSPKERKQQLHEFQQAELTFREYHRDLTDASKNKEGQELGTKENPYVLGGFGAYGNPSSFHNECVRHLRTQQAPYVVPVLGHLLQRSETQSLIPRAKDYKIALLFDRMCKRPKGTSTTKESYHRDLLPNGRSTDVTIGGWIQLSDDTSYLACHPKTHMFPVLEQPTSLKGFATQKGKQCTREVPVRPGSILLFFQNLGHCVHSIKRKSDSYRLFSVWLLTTHSTSLFDYSEIVKTQGVPCLPSSQKTAMYGGNHASVWLQTMTIPWSLRNFLPQVLKRHAKGYTTVDRYMKSLQEYGLPMYPPYQTWETRIFQPFHRLSHEVSLVYVCFIMEHGERCQVCLQNPVEQIGDVLCQDCMLSPIPKGT